MRRDCFGEVGPEGISQVFVFLKKEKASHHLLNTVALETAGAPLLLHLAS